MQKAHARNSRPVARPSFPPCNRLLLTRAWAAGVTRTPLGARPSRAPDLATVCCKGRRGESREAPEQVGELLGARLAREPLAHVLGQRRPVQPAGAPALDEVDEGGANSAHVV